MSRDTYFTTTILIQSETIHTENYQSFLSILLSVTVLKYNTYI